VVKSTTPWLGDEDWKQL